MRMLGNSRAQTALLVLLFTFALVSTLLAGAPAAKKETTALPVVQASDTDTLRVQGEQRFRANCGRCHAAPQKFPSRMMATVLRHMRVRATITAEDRRLILLYMTQ